MYTWFGGRADAFLSCKSTGSCCTCRFTVQGSCFSLLREDKPAPDLWGRLTWHPLGKLSHQRPLCFSVLTSLPACTHAGKGQGQNTSDFKSLIQMFLTQTLLWAANIPRCFCFKSNTFIRRSFQWCLNSGILQTANPMVFRFETYLILPNKDNQVAARILVWWFFLYHFFFSLIEEITWELTGTEVDRTGKHNHIFVIVVTLYFPHEYYFSTHHPFHW